MIALDDKQVLAIYIKGAKAKNRYQEPESEGYHLSREVLVLVNLKLGL